MVKGGWAEAYVGPEWTPFPWMTIGINAGVEQLAGEFDLRTAYTLWMGHGPINFLGIVEAGRAAYAGDEAAIWYDLALKYTALPWLAVGIKDRRFAGVGPLAELTWPEANLTGWVAWAPIGNEKAEFITDRFMFGAKIGF